MIMTSLSLMDRLRQDKDMGQILRGAEETTTSVNSAREL